MRQFILITVFFFTTCTDKTEIAYKQAYKLYSKKQIESLEQAINQFDDIINYSLMAMSGKVDALQALGHKYTQAEMYLQAAKCFEEVVKIAPNSFQSWYFAGLNYANYAKYVRVQKEKDAFYQKSLNYYLTAEQIAPNNASILYGLGLLYGLFLNDYKKAVYYLKKSKNIDQANLSTRFTLAKVYYLNNNNLMAEKEYQSIMDIAEQNSEQFINAKKNLSQIESR